MITRRLLMPDFLFTDNLYIRFDISSVCHYILSECFIYCCWFCFLESLTARFFEKALTLTDSKTAYFLRQLSFRISFFIRQILREKQIDNVARNFSWLLTANGEYLISAFFVYKLQIKVVARLYLLLLFRNADVCYSTDAANIHLKFLPIFEKCLFSYCLACWKPEFRKDNWILYEGVLVMYYTLSAAGTAGYITGQVCGAIFLIHVLCRKGKQAAKSIRMARLGFKKIRTHR